MTISLVLLGGVLVAILVLAIAIRQIAVLLGERRAGSLVAVDVAGEGRTLRSTRWALAGRPDELRRLRDGRLVPIEIKSRRAPPRGPPPSHRLQVAAYAFLLEEETGRAPPYGILRYSDGSEWTVPWDRSAREEVLRVLSAVRSRYDGRATPSRGRCGHCRWRLGCDARAV